MPKIQWKPTEKQVKAYEYLKDKTTTELLYGGGAGGGKSHLGCAWIVSSCLLYPGTRWLIGRAHLKTLKESTLLTFFKVCRDWGLIMNVDYKYNSMAAVVQFTKTGSEVYLKDLFDYPSDPNFDELGSTEYSGAFIDEASQVSQKAYEIVMSRIRFKLTEFGLIPKLLTCTNPTKNFLYREFYKKNQNNELEPYRKFVPALVDDNPYMPGAYKENLKKLDKVSKERLLFGNWEYDDDPAKLFEYDSLISMFTNALDVRGNEQKYLTCDVARFGNDKTVIMVWNGLTLTKIYAKTKQSTVNTVEMIKELCKQHEIPMHQVAIDEDGVGGGVVDMLPGVRGFVNNSKPLEPIVGPITANYMNLKSQCYFFLAEYVNNNRIAIKEASNEAKQLIIEDLEQVKRHNPDKDMKLQVTPKEEIKEHLGRSPDFGDAMMMRMIFQLKKPYQPYIGALNRQRY